MSKVVSLRLELFKHSHDSFLKALDEEGIQHSPIHMFSSAPRASSFTESITAIAENMPWNSIAKVMIAWIEARSSREIMITTEDLKVIHLKGYSVSDAEKIIKKAQNVAVIDTVPNNET